MPKISSKFVLVPVTDHNDVAVIKDLQATPDQRVHAIAVLCKNRWVLEQCYSSAHTDEIKDGLVALNEIIKLGEESTDY